MNKIILFVALIALFAAFSIAQKADYNGHKVVRVRVDSKENLKLLKSILPTHVDIWSYDSNLVIGSNDIRVTDDLLGNITENGFQYESWIDDVQAYLDAPEPESENRTLRADDPWYTSYHRYSEIVDRLKQLAAAYPDFTTYVPSIGKSIEGRDIPAILVGARSSSSVKRVWINGGQHAREWVGPSTVLYILEKLLTENTKDAVTTEILTKSQFVIVPLVNPDGYEYAWTNDRLWRKNRRNNGANSFGVDLNRNWDIQWGGGGSSGDRNSDTYRGTAPFSEPESKVVSDYLKSNNLQKNIIAAIDFHSYSQLILRPYGYTNTNCPDEVRLKSLGATMATEIQKKYGLAYSNIKSIELYVTTGTAGDWFYAIGIVPSYTFELRDTGTYGFRLPTNQIIPTGEENWAAVKKFIITLLT